MEKQNERKKGEGEGEEGNEWMKTEVVDASIYRQGARNMNRNV